jgi:hypothetical protein
MKILSLLAAISVAGAAMSVSAAEPPKESDRDQQQVIAIVKDIQAQQVTMADNQKKIDEKLVTVAEALRLAKIYASRGGR